VIVPLDAASNDLSFPGRHDGLHELSFLGQLADGLLQFLHASGVLAFELALPGENVARHRRWLVWLLGRRSGDREQNDRGDDAPAKNQRSVKHDARRYHR
jgi:hypothetical protein